MSKLNKHLYRFCDSWFHGGSVYVLSDPHFDDEDMDWRGITADELVKRINSKACKSDTLVILGDIGNVERVKQLRAGYKVLITGNHDAGNSIYENVFDEIYNGPLFVSDKLLLSHEPINFKFAFNIHGHTHALDWLDDDNHMCVCVEKINFTPISITEIIKSGVLKRINSIHRETINEATENKKWKKNTN